MIYSDIVKKYFQNPVNLGKIENADAVGIITNKFCTDIIKIYLKLDEKNLIKDVKFEANGCPPVIASCCILTETIKNIKIDDAKNITSHDIIQKLHGLPKEKQHCAELVIETLNNAINNIK